VGFKPIKKEIKEQILERVKQGIPVLQLAREHAVHEKTIYDWLNKSTQKVPSYLEYAKVKRERDDLLKIVGELNLKVSRGEKKRTH
jgi:hypothetical protein